VQPDVFVRSVLGIELLEPDHIESDNGDSEVAGKMNRTLRQIVIAQKFTSEYQRFTAAHEIGHWVLHTDALLFRDKLLSGGERANQGRPVVEREADLFAAEFLMPEKIVRERFAFAFGDTIGGSDPRLEFLQLSRPHLSLSTLSADLRRRSWFIAEVGPLGLAQPLHKQFGVSTVAMAIQLEYFGLVV
jgi:Zn-dependent peptidase ImmA (M78 family)